MRAIDSTLRVQEVSVSLGTQRTLGPLTFTLTPGSLMGVLGPNGAGKTSLLAACTGERALSAGSLTYDGQPVIPADSKHLSRRRAVLPQHSQLTFNLPVQHIVQMGAYPFPEISPAQVNIWMDHAITVADLGSHLHRPYSALSGGEQQRVQFARVWVQALAIAQVQGHAYLFLDEPTASLDVRHQIRLFQALQQLASTKTIAVFVVLHDINMAARWCDTILLLSSDGRAVFGQTASVLTKSTLERVYGIGIHIEPHPLKKTQIMVLAKD